MNLLRSLRGGAPAGESRYSWDAYQQDLAQFSFNGMGYGPLVQTLAGGGTEERVENSFAGYVEGAYKRNGVVFACLMARLMLFTEARFAFARRVNGRLGDVFGMPELAILEKPDQNMTTGELLARMEQDVSLAGNWFGTRRIRRDGMPRIRRLRPDWVTIVMGTTEADAADAGPDDVDAEVLGYVYAPSSGRKLVFLPDEVAHFSPIPDPNAHWRGMSWLTPVLREIQADGAATTHKAKFFENGATPNLVVSLDKDIGKDAFLAFKEAMDEGHQGVLNAYKTLYLGGGADVKIVGSTFEQMSFKATQGAGETRIAAAAGVPPIVVGLSEGLDAATYSNYGQARRKFADSWAHPQWRMAAAALAPLVKNPTGAELVTDLRDVPFLREDGMDAASIRNTQAAAIKALTDAGYDAVSVVQAVTSGDLTLLQHSGMFSVQLHPPGTHMTPSVPTAPAKPPTPPAKKAS